MDIHAKLALQKATLALIEAEKSVTAIIRSDTEAYSQDWMDRQGIMALDDHVQQACSLAKSLCMRNGLLPETKFAKEK